MIQPDNIVFIKPVTPHPMEKVLQASERIKPLPGIVAVMADPFVEQVNGILMPDGKYRGSQDSDTGTVVASGVSELRTGDRVAYKPMHGLRCGYREFPWVPEGTEVRFYGIATDWYESIVCKIEEA